MVINWTKIIILIVVIGAFTGIIVGILVAFRSQCPDGKIYNKTCKKCVTKCDDGYNLPTKDGGIDCDSETCQIDCKDQCRLDDTTCGTKCGTKCCGVGFGCGNTTMECGKYNCPSTSGPGAAPGIVPNVYCDGDQKCVIAEDGSGYCENITSCPAARKLDNGECCEPDQKAYNGNMCCEKELCGKNCCEDSEACVLGKCLPICPGVPTGVCSEGQFCMEDDESGKKTYSCETNNCNWGDTEYIPVPEDGGEGKNQYRICTIGETQGPGDPCTPSENHPYVKGAWARDWSYAGEKAGGLCRSVTIKSGTPNKCNETACREKIAEKGLIDAGWTTFNKEGKALCTGVIDCANSPGYLPTTASPKPNDDKCLDSGVCCDENSKPCGNIWCIPSTDTCLLDSSGRLCGAYFDPKFKTAENMAKLSKNHVGGPEDWCDDKCKLGWGVSGKEFCSIENCDNVTCLSEKNGGYMIYYQDDRDNDICTLSNCAINPATGKNEPPFDRCCAWAEPSDGVSQPIKGLPNYGDVNLSSKAIDCKNDRSSRKSNCGNYGQTCDNWCKGKGLGGGTMHGTPPTCEKKCSDYDRTMAIPNSEGTKFINFDEADCMQAGYKTSDNILGSKAWIDFGEYCDSGDKVCVCDKTALPSGVASSLSIHTMAGTAPLKGGASVCKDYVQDAVIASKEELVNIQTCDDGWAGTSDSDSGEFSGLWRDTTVKKCGTRGYNTSSPNPPNVFCNKDKRVFRHNVKDDMSLEESVAACKEIGGSLATKSDIVGNTNNDLGCSTQWVSDGTDDGWKGFWSWGGDGCGTDGQGFYEKTGGTQKGAACSNANVHLVENNGGFDITNVHDAARLCISKGYEGGLATKAQLMSFPACDAGWASDGTDDGWKGFWSNGNEKGNGSWEPNSGPGCGDNRGYYDKGTAMYAYCVTYNNSIP